MTALKRLWQAWQDTLSGDSPEITKLREEHARARMEREQAQDEHMETTQRWNRAVHWVRDQEGVDALHRLADCRPDPPRRRKSDVNPEARKK